MGFPGAASGAAPIVLRTLDIVCEKLAIDVVELRRNINCFILEFTRAALVACPQDRSNLRDGVRRVVNWVFGPSLFFSPARAASTRTCLPDQAVCDQGPGVISERHGPPFLALGLDRGEQFWARL